LYFEDAGYERVRHLAASNAVACAQHGRSEVISGFHRKLGERVISARLYEITLQEFLTEIRVGAFRWLPLSENVFERAELVYARLLQRSFCVLQMLCISQQHPKTAFARFIPMMQSC